MDASSLVKAHDHARAAAVATRQASDTTVAINEHTQAAGEFAGAAQSTSSVEALRMLKLLEDHHRRLAALLNLPAHQPSQQPGSGEVTDEKSQAEEGSVDGDDVQRKKGSLPDPPVPKAAQKPGLPQQRRYASREMSSSIASNLASARGIKSKYRGQPLSPSVSNDQAPGNVDAHPRRDGSKTKMQNIIDHQSGKPAWVPPMPTSPTNKTESHGKPSTAAATPSPGENATAVDDGGYTKFYNTFGSFINRISAPLAFAGLPLIQEESTMSEEPTSPEPSPSKRKPVQPAQSANDPDLSKIYSKSAMRAISHDAHGPSESFYIVPTSGHTISYANILSYAEKEKRRLGASHHSTLREGTEDDDDDFVDATETPALSPGAQRRVGRARTERELSNTIEELYTENESLKDMLDKLTKRLHMFEASAQNMAESYRLMRPGSPLSTGTSGGGNKSKDRQADLEEFSSMKDHIDRLEKDNKKMQRTLEKYRAKWEALKAGAKARRAPGSVEDAEAS